VDILATVTVAPDDAPKVEEMMQRHGATTCWNDKNSRW